MNIIKVLNSPEGKQIYEFSMTGPMSTVEVSKVRSEVAKSRNHWSDALAIVDRWSAGA